MLFMMISFVFLATFHSIKLQMQSAEYVTEVGLDCFSFPRRNFSVRFSCPNQLHLYLFFQRLPSHECPHRYERMNGFLKKILKENQTKNAMLLNCHSFNCIFLCRSSFPIKMCHCMECFGVWKMNFETDFSRQLSCIFCTDK